jgi:hypothetical protein
MDLALFFHGGRRREQKVEKKLRTLLPSDRRR